MALYNSCRPSKSGIFFECPGALSLSRQIAKTNQSNDAANVGTIAHAMLADSIDLQRSPEFFLNKKVKKEGKYYVITQREVDAVSVFLNYIANQNYIQLVSELYLDFDFLKRCELRSGTADCVILRKNTFEVIDFKNGFGVYDHHVRQVMIYALAVYNKLSKKIRILAVDLTIIQPNAIKGSERFRTRRISTDALLTFQKDVLIPKIIATSVKNPKISAHSEDACKFCDVATACRARFNKIKKIIERIMSNKEHDYKLLTTEEQANIVLNAKILKEYIDKITAEVHSEVMKSPGDNKFSEWFEVKKSRGRKRLVSNAIRIIGKFFDKDEEYFDMDIFFKKTLKSMTDIKAIINKVIEEPQEKKELLGSLIEHSEDKETVVAKNTRK